MTRRQLILISVVACVAAWIATTYTIDALSPIKSADCLNPRDHMVTSFNPLTGSRTYRCVANEPTWSEQPH